MTTIADVKRKFAVVGMTTPRLDWPFNPSLTTSEFGWRTLQNGKRDHHNGLDFWYAGIEGDPIRAVADGEVFQVFTARKGNDLGNAVRIRHQERPFRLSTGYAHMKSRPLVKVGDRVKRGQVIGYVGNTGLSFGAHLHFEFWKGDGPGSSVRIDPRRGMALLGSGKIVGATAANPAPASTDVTPIPPVLPITARKESTMLICHIPNNPKTGKRNDYHVIGPNGLVMRFTGETAARALEKQIGAPSAPVSEVLIKQLLDRFKSQDVRVVNLD